MKKAGIYILLSFLLLGCASKKIKTKSEVDEDLIQRIETIIKETSKKEETSITKEALKENTVIREVEYDTDKPVDEKTGRPPVKKETTIENNVDKVIDENKDVKEDVSKSEVKNEDTDLNKKEKINTVEEDKGNRTMLYVAIFSFVILLLVFLLLLNKAGVFKRRK